MADFYILGIINVKSEVTCYTNLTYEFNQYNQLLI